MPFTYSQYEPQFTTQAAALMGAPLRAQGQAALASADAQSAATLAAGRARANIAQSVGTTASDLLRLPTTLAEDRVKKEQLTEADAAAQDEAAIRQAEQQHAGDADQVQATLAKTRPTAAAKYQTRTRALHLQALQENKLQTDAAMDSITKISQVLSGVNDVPAEQRPAAYQAALPTILQFLPPQGHGDVPKEFDQTYVDTAIAKGRTAKERLELLQASNHALELASTQAKDKREAEKFYTEAVARRFQTADSQQELDAIMADSKAHGVPETVLNQFPTTFSVNAKEKAAQFLPSADRPKPPPASAQEYEYAKTQGFKGTFEQYQNEDANRHKSTVNVNTGPNANIPGDWNVSGEAFLKTIPPQWRKTVEKIAKYDEDPTKVASMRGGMREMLTQWVNQVNPSYDQSSFAIRNPTRKAFTTGTQGQQITALNTAIEHLDQLQAAADALANGSFKPGNAAYNYLRDTFGSGAPTTFEAIKEKVDKELDAVASKGAPTVSGAAAQKAIGGITAGPAQIKAYIDANIPLMGSTLNALHHQYTQAMGADDPWKPLTPEAQAILDKRGVKPGDQVQGGGGVTVAAPSGGKSYSFPDQAAADRFVADAKAKGLWK